MFKNLVIIELNEINFDAVSFYIEKGGYFLDHPLGFLDYLFGKPNRVFLLEENLGQGVLRSDTPE